MNDDVAVRQQERREAVRKAHADNTVWLSSEAEECFDDCTALLSELDALRAELNEMDDLVNEYCIDTVGTGPGPTKKEERRVDAILERSRNRREQRTLPQKGTDG